jgi:hypothetical protein
MKWAQSSTLTTIVYLFRLQGTKEMSNIMSMIYRKWELGSGVFEVGYNKKITRSLIQMHHH